MPSQVYILIAAAAVMFCVIGGLSLLAHYYTLNGIKSRTVGDGQHGTARFASKQEIKNTYQHIPFQPELWRQGQCRPTASQQGVILGSKGEKNAVTALVDTDDVHILMIGASGVGKTAFFLYPNMEYACASGMSFLALDTKGDLARNYGSIAKKILRVQCVGHRPAKPQPFQWQQSAHPHQPLHGYLPQGTR